MSKELPEVSIDMNNISVCTIYAKRKLHLQNLVKGLILSSVYPDELVVVCMNDRLPDLPQTPFKIATANINTDRGTLPVAAARNKAAAVARGNKLIFLDVDCISDRNLVNNFNYHLEREDALYSGSVRYLSQDWHSHDQRSQQAPSFYGGVICDWTFASLKQQSAFHRLQGTAPEEKEKRPHPYELFWSLNFGIRKQTFENLGGFDERYDGYAGEDTDLAFTARSHHLPHYKIAALAYHQFHDSHTPPLNHLADIVCNARVFYDKWQILPMDKWLKQFADLGYIELRDNEVTIIKYPTKAEIEACRNI